MKFQNFIKKSIFTGISLCLSVSALLAQTADFEGLLSQPDTNWHGDTPGLSYFQSGAFKFANSYDTAWGGFWSGAAYANIASGEYIDSLGYGNEFKNVAGGGAEGSASYGVLYDLAKVLYTGDTLQGVRLNGCYMTNSVMLYNTAMNGDPFAGEPFKTGDFFKAVIAGISPQGDTSYTEFYLADYRDTVDTTRHYILKTWEWVDLSGLGKIKSLLISFEGSRVGQYGQNLPLYAAIDNLSVKQETGVEEAPAVLCRLYPVPAKEVLHVETRQGNCRAEIFSVQGRKMAEHRLAGTHSVLSLQGLLPGMYLLRLTCGTQVSTSRFVVGR